MRGRITHTLAGKPAGALIRASVMENTLLPFRPGVLPLALSCAFAAAWPAHAQTPSESTTVAQASGPSLPETVVTATRVAQPLTDVLADVTLIDREQIEQSGAVSVSDLLQRQPGLELSRNGQQIILATHDYVLLKWLDLLGNTGTGDHIRFHALSRENGDVQVQSADDYRQLNSNAIANTFRDLYDEEIQRSLGGA